MTKLYCVPLGHSPRSLFYEKLQSVGYDKGVLVLPSRILMHKAEREANIRTIDIDFLATTILNDNGYLNLKPINRRSQELVIKDLVKQLATREQLEYFGALADKPGFIKALTSLVGQLSRSGATETEIREKLAEWGRSGNLGLKDREISLLYTAYRFYLKDNNWFDLEGKYRLAIRVLQEEKVKLRWQEVCISDFFTFDALQIEFIKALGKRTNVSIGLMYEAKKEDVFQAVENTYGDLMKFCELEQVQLEGNEAPRNVRVCQLPNRELEMAWVLTEVKKLIFDGVKAQDILVTFRKFDNYNGLRNLADAYGIPVSIPQSSALNLQPLTEFVLLLLEAQPDNRKGAEAYFKLLNCGMGRLLFPEAVEYAYAWRQEKYYTTRTQVQAKCSEQFEDLKGLTLVDDALSKLKATATVSEYAAVLEELLDSLKLQELLGQQHKDGLIEFTMVKACLQSKELILRCLEALTEDYKNCKLNEEKLSLQDFGSSLREALQDYQITLVDGRNDGMLITEVINAQGLEHKYVFLLGLREGEFPIGSSENWIYNDGERKELNDMGIDMPTSNLAYAEDTYFFAATIAQARKSLVLTYHVDDQAGASAYVSEMQKLHPNLQVEQILDKEHASIGEACALKEQLDLEWVFKHIGVPALYSSQADKAREVPNYFNGILEDEAVQEDVAKAVGNLFSASSLEVYAQCPFRFLGERIWKQKEFAEKEELAAPADEGSLLHACLAKFLGKHLHEKLLKYEYAVLWEELQQDFQEVCAEFVDKGILQQNELWAAEEGRLLNVLRRWLRYEYDLQQQWEFVPCDVELDFSSKNGKPLRFYLEDGSSFAIMGRIDRIDSNGSKVFVTDYKLSGTPAGSDLPAGVDLQLPVYLLAAANLYRKDVAGGGYLSLKQTKRNATVKLDATEKFPFNQKAKDYFADEEDKWQAFEKFSRKLLIDYVKGIYTGEFMVQPKTKCSKYCPLKDICRVNILQQGGEVDE